ncbi:hypothetical protein Herbaro_05595 [Herbaspirillum sp. WKF16]|uniref:hypothetical protein n=1 Tax=Herbaspirillum sp. WKF16 TaxID=3028312 RepID=UPI0023A9E8CA|nr:hypothetical protein [Herbaspirillum sp. WKF16]WDZ97263.1 hypothetical protein Herbaro_05595 [Herbaspirillum sp. WKF16]
MKRYPAVILLLLAVAGCSRSPEEQLAYQHAEEQYQINQRNAQLLRQAPDSPEEGQERAPRGREPAGS